MIMFLVMDRITTKWLWSYWRGQSWKSTLQKLRWVDINEGGIKHDMLPCHVCKCIDITILVAWCRFRSQSWPGVSHILGWSLYVKKCLPKFQHYTKYKGSLLFQQQINYKSFEILCFCLILDTQCNTCVCVRDRPMKSINHEPFFLILLALIYLIYASKYWHC